MTDMTSGDATKWLLRTLPIPTYGPLLEIQSIISNIIWCVEGFQAYTIHPTS